MSFPKIRNGSLVSDSIASFLDLREPSSLLIARAVTDPPPATLCTWFVHKASSSAQQTHKFTHSNVPYFNVWSACVFTSSSQNITLPVWSTLQTSCTSGGIDLARSAALVSDHASLGMKLPSWSAVPLPQSGSSDLWFDMQRVVQSEYLVVIFYGLRTLGSLERSASSRFKPSWRIADMLSSCISSRASKMDSLPSHCAYYQFPGRRTVLLPPFSTLPQRMPASRHWLQATSVST